MNDGKNEQLVYEGIRSGVALAHGLQTALEQAVSSLPIPKVMHYQLADGETTVSFVRPAKHLVALFGADVVPVSVLGLTADRLTSGHRFHTRELLSIKNADGYEAQMQSEGKVMASFAKRREKIVHDVKTMAQAIGGVAIMPEDLIDEVTALTEWPVIYESSFDEEFLSKVLQPRVEVLGDIPNQIDFIEQIKSRSFWSPPLPKTSMHTGFRHFKLLDATGANPRFRTAAA